MAFVCLSEPRASKGSTREALCDDKKSLDQNTKGPTRLLNNQRENTEFLGGKMIDYIRERKESENPERGGLRGKGGTTGWSSHHIVPTMRIYKQDLIAALGEFVGTTLFLREEQTLGRCTLSHAKCGVMQSSPLEEQRRLRSHGRRRSSRGCRRAWATRQSSSSPCPLVSAFW